MSGPCATPGSGSAPEGRQLARTLNARPGVAQTPTQLAAASRLSLEEAREGLRRLTLPASSRPRTSRRWTQTGPAPERELFLPREVGMLLERVDSRARG